MTYSCSKGTLEGQQCLTSSTYPAKAGLGCNAGDSLRGSTCTHTSTFPATVIYSCPNGGTLSGGTCLKTTAYAATEGYSCPSGAVLSGRSCSQTTTYAATNRYTCNAGDRLDGSTCTHITASAATPAYSCPNGGTLSGSQCVGPNLTRTAYIYLGGRQIAETVVNGVRQYVHTDALGSPVAHTDQTGAVLNRTKFEPYGYTAAGTKPGPTLAGLATTGSVIGLTGHVNDPETDLVYMQQRYYDPVAGRFLSIDPVTTDANTGGSFNRYAYANNSPYKYVDPDGRFGVLGALVGAGIEVGLQIAMEGRVNNWTAVGIAGAAGAITGGLGGIIGKAAVSGTVTTGRAAAAAAAVGGAAGATSKVAEASLTGKSTSSKEVAVAAALGAVGSAAGAKIGLSAVAKVESLAGRGGVAGHIGTTTQAAMQQGGRVVEASTTAGQKAAQHAADTTSAYAEKKINQ